MKGLMIACTIALWSAHAGLARAAAAADLGDTRLAPIDDPYSVRFQGGPPEVTKEKIAQAIKSIGATRGWTVAREAEGRIDLTLLVRGQHEASIEVEYSASTYSLRYVRSVNLLYREQLRSGVALRVIHRNYNGWVKGLVTGVNNSIPAPAQIVVGFAPLADANAVPYLKEKGREVYREFLTLPSPRAFAIAPNGVWGRDSYKNVPTAVRRDVVENAVEFCNRRGGKGECRLYAIDDRVVWPASGAPAASAGAAARALSGEELAQHVARLAGAKFNSSGSIPFTMSIAADGKAERTCDTCPRPTGTGTMTLKSEEGLVCFQWEQITYPDSGCFKVMQTGSNAYQMRGTNGERAIRYSLAP